MQYRVLGFIVWKGGKIFLKRKYGPVKTPKSMMVGGAGLAVVGGAMLVKSRLSSS